VRAALAEPKMRSDASTRYGTVLCGCIAFILVSLLSKTASSGASLFFAHVPYIKCRGNPADCRPYAVSKSTKQQKSPLKNTVLMEHCQIPDPKLSAKAFTTNTAISEKQHLVRGMEMTVQRPHPVSPAEIIQVLNSPYFSSMNCGIVPHRLSTPPVSKNHGRHTLRHMTPVQCHGRLSCITDIATQALAQRPFHPAMEPGATPTQEAVRLKECCHGT